MLLRARGGTRSREEMAEAAAPEPPPPPPPPDDDEDDEERLCRFCLCGDDDEPDPDDRELLSATLGRPSTAPNRACTAAAETPLPPVCPQPSCRRARARAARNGCTSSACTAGSGACSSRSPRIQRSTNETRGSTVGHRTAVTVVGPLAPGCARSPTLVLLSRSVSSLQDAVQHPATLARGAHGAFVRTAHTTMTMAAAHTPGSASLTQSPSVDRK